MRFRWHYLSSCCEAGIYSCIQSHTVPSGSSSASAQCSQRPAGLANVGLFLPVAGPGRAWPGLGFKSLMGHPRVPRPDSGAPSFMIVRFLLLEAAPSGSPARAHAVAIQRPRGRPNGGEARPGARLRRPRPTEACPGLPLCTPPGCRGPRP